MIQWLALRRFNYIDVVAVGMLISGIEAKEYLVAFATWLVFTIVSAVVERYVRDNGSLDC